MAALKIQITTNGFDAIRAALVRAQSPAKRKVALQAGADAAINAVKGYYSKMGSNAFSDKTGPTWGGGRKSTGFAKLVESGWNIKSVNSQTVEIANKTIGLAHQIDGGTIVPKRRKFLTIPLIPQAHGHTARSYGNNIKALFPIIKADKSSGIMAQKNDDKSITPVFALKKSVTHKPNPNALPPEAEYLDPFLDAALKKIVEELEKNG
jgi:hypothetical protein